jgi:hypothetical protein
VIGSLLKRTKKVANSEAGSIVKQADLVDEMILQRVVIQLAELLKLNAIKLKVKCIKRKALNEFLGKNLKRNPSSSHVLNIIHGYQDKITGSTSSIQKRA